MVRRSLFRTKMVRNDAASFSKPLILELFKIGSFYAVSDEFLSTTHSNF